jgi:hypothetical protein
MRSGKEEMSIPLQQSHTGGSMSVSLPRPDAPSLQVSIDPDRLAAHS